MKKTLLFLLITVTASVLAMAGLGLTNNVSPKSPKADTASTGYEYTIPAGSIKTDNAPTNWLDNLSTTGAQKDITFTQSANPASNADLYTLVEDQVDAIPGSSFTLNLNAHKKNDGGYSQSTVYQDLRFCCAYIWVDWYGNGNFEKVQFYGTVAPDDNIGGNFGPDHNDVMDIAKELTMPENVTIGTQARIRVIYSNAWSVPTATGATGRDMETADPNTQYINEGLAYDIVVNAVEAPKPTYAVTIADTDATVNANVDDLTAVEEGTQVTFTVTAPEGKQIASVSYNDEALTPNEDGTYTITVTADGTLTVVTEEVTTPQPTGNKAVKFLATQGYATTYVKPQGDDRIEIPETLLTNRSEASDEYVTLETSFTYSGWFNLTDWFQADNKSIGSGLLIIGQRVHANNNPSLGLVVTRPADYHSTTNKRGNGGILKLVCADPQNSTLSGSIEGEGTTLNLDEWVYLTMVYDKEAQEVRVYKDGQRILARKSALPLRLLPDYPGIISTGAFALNGACDELQFWTKALTDAEVLTAYYSPDKVSGLDLWYDFDTIIPSEEDGAESGKFANKGTTEKGKGILATYYHVAKAAKLDYSGAGLANLATFTEKTPELIDGREKVELPSYTITIPEVKGGTFTVSDGTQSYTAGDHKFNVGTGLTATVTPNDGYHLTALKYAGEYIENGSSVTVSGDAAFEVGLTDAICTITIAETEATYNMSAPNGTELDLSKVPVGTEIRFTLTKWPEGKTLKEVRLGEEVLEADENGVYTFTASESTTLTIELRDLAKFTVNYTQILDNGSLEVNDAKGAMIMPGATVLEGSTITVTPTPSTGYSLQYLRINGEDFEAETEYTVLSDIEVTTAFAEAVAFVPGRQKNGSTTHNYSFRFSEDALGEHTAGSCDEPADLGTTDKRSRNFTYAAWIKPTSRSLYTKEPMGRLMGDIQEWGSGVDGAFSVEMTAEGKLALNARVYSTATAMPGIAKLVTDTDIALNEWAFIAVVADHEAKTLTLYKNGEPCGSLDTSKDADGNEAYGIGLLPEACQFYVYDFGAAGYLEEVQLWNRALTQQEVRRATRLNYTKQYDGLVSYYRPRKDNMEIANYSTANELTAGMYAGMYTSNKWVTPALQLIIDTGAAHEPEYVTVTTVQPTDNIGTFSLTGEEGRAINGTAYLFEDLTVDLSNISGATVTGITVTTDDTATDYTLEQLPFTTEGNCEVSLKYEVKKTVAFTYTGEHGKITVKINDEEPVEVTEPIEVPKNSTLVITAIPDEHYELTAATINGEKVYDLYEIEENEEDPESYDFYDNEYTLKVEEKNVDLNLTFNLERFFLYAVLVDAAGDDTDLYPAFSDAEGTTIDEDSPDFIYLPYGSEASLSIWSVSPDNYGENDGHNIISQVVDYPFDAATNDYLDPIDVTSQLESIPTGDKEDVIYHIGTITQSHFFYIYQSYAGIISISADANNPMKVANGIITIGENAMIEVTDMNGRTVARTEGSELNVQNLVKGVYVAKATTANEVYTLKFIKL